MTEHLELSPHDLIHLRDVLQDAPHSAYRTRYLRMVESKIEELNENATAKQARNQYIAMMSAGVFKMTEQQRAAWHYYNPVCIF